MSEAAALLRKAMKGWGTNEKALIECIGTKTNAEIIKINEAYTNEIKRDLMKDIKDECSGDFENTLVAILTPSDMYDAQLLRKAMKGIGTTESLLTEVLCTRTPQHLAKVMTAYEAEFKRDLLSDLSDETSGKVCQVYETLARNAREGKGYEEKSSIEKDIKLLYDAGQNKLGTNESVFVRILTENSREYCEKLYYAYADEYGKALDAVIKSEMSGNLGKSLATLVTPLEIFFSENLYKSMKGVGTNDADLIRYIVSIRERCLVKTSKRFLSDYKATLAKWVEDECSGDYKKLLLKILDFFGDITK